MKHCGENVRFMQITFKYECVQVLFQDLPALVKDLDGSKGYRSLKRKEKQFLSSPDIDLICNIVCTGHLFAVVLMISQFSCLECNTFIIISYQFWEFPRSGQIRSHTQF